ncbi:hypothetical protein SLA2020_068780 [Shorea laevis]
MRGASYSPVEARHRFSVSTKDAKKRWFPRRKDSTHVERAPYVPIRLKIFIYKIFAFKAVLIVILLGCILTIFHSPAVYNTDRPSNFRSRPSFVERSMRDYSEDSNYVSNLDINWDQISNVVEKLTDRNQYQGIGLLNFTDSEIDHWNELIPDVEHVVMHLEYVSDNVTWESLYPEWIDEEEEFEVPTCPSLPSLQVPGKPRIDLIAIKLPCKKSGKWSRDVARLHLQLAAARLAASAKGFHPVQVLFLTDCFPIPNLFTCKDLVAHEGNAWLYEPNLHKLREKIRLSVGSCELTVPLKAKENFYSERQHREAYATILHSAHVYVCGAIAAAQSIRMAGSSRDLVLLFDESISEYHRGGLEAAGWKIHIIQRIRNPKAEPDAYNEWNYSKFCLWQLTDYDKIVFIDADLLMLRNIDFLFEMPEISATGNNSTLFNSGVMVVEPSNCTFQLLMDHINEIESYNGGDQG